MRKKGRIASARKTKPSRSSGKTRTVNRYSGLTKAELLEELARLERSHERLKSSNRKLRVHSGEMDDLFSLSMDMLCVASMTHFVKVNPAFERVLGYTEDELLAIPFIDLIHPDDAGPTASYIEKKLKMGEPAIRFRNRYRAKDGSYRLLEWMTRPVPEEGLLFGVARDMTLQVEAESERGRTLMLLEAVMDNTEDIVFVKDADGRHLLVNRMFIEVLGIPMDEVIGRTVLEIFPEEIGRKMWEADERVFSTGITETVEEEVLTRSGERRYYLSTKSVLRDDGGNPMGTLGVAHDITQRREMEQALIESEQAYRGMFEGSPMPMIVFDPETYEIHGVNDAAVAHYGWSRDEFLSMTVKDIRPEEEIPKLVDAVRRSSEGLDRAGIFLHRKKDGTVMKVEITAHPITFERRPARLAMVNDVTERLNAEEAIRESKERLRLLSEATFEGIGIAEKGRIIDANEQMAQMLGYELPELIGLELEKTIHPEDWALVKRRRSEGFDGRYSHRALRKDGSVIHIEVCGKEINYRGRQVRQTVMRDITESKRMEEKLFQNLMEKEVLLQEIHHRVKNNLNVVVSLLKLQERTLTDAESRKRFREGQARVMAIARLHEMIYRSEDFSLIDVKDYLESIAVHVLSTYRREGDTVDLKVDVDGADLTIDQLIPCGLIVNELVTNSLKHAFPEGQGGSVEISLRRSEDEMLLSVSDSGIGIPEDAVHEGSGNLGFVIVPALARQLGGDYGLDRSDPSRVFVRFPVSGPAGRGA